MADDCAALHRCRCCCRLAAAAAAAALEGIDVAPAERQTLRVAPAVLMGINCLTRREREGVEKVLLLRFFFPIEKGKPTTTCQCPSLISSKFKRSLRIFAQIRPRSDQKKKCYRGAQRKRSEGDKDGTFSERKKSCEMHKTRTTASSWLLSLSSFSTPAVSLSGRFFLLLPLFCSSILAVVAVSGDILLRSISSITKGKMRIKVSKSKEKKAALFSTVRGKS